MRHRRALIAAVSLAVLTACSGEKTDEESNSPASPVWLSVRTPTDYVVGKSGYVVLQVSNQGPRQNKARVDLSFDLKNAPESGISVEYEQPGPRPGSWKAIRLSSHPSGDGSPDSLTGSYQAPVPKGSSELRLRLTPKGHPTAQGQSIGITANLRGARESLATGRGKASLANIEVSTEKVTEYVRRNGEWSEYVFAVNNRSTVDYPRIQALAFLCRETEGDCRPDASAAGLDVQWKSEEGWKDLDTSAQESALSEEGSGRLEDGAILDTNLALAPLKSRPLHFRVKAAGGFIKDDWQGELQLLARQVPASHASMPSTASASFRVGEQTAP